MRFSHYKRYQNVVFFTEWGRSRAEQTAHTWVFCITFDLHFCLIFQLTTLMFMKFKMQMNRMHVLLRHPQNSIHVLFNITYWRKHGCWNWNACMFKTSTKFNTCTIHVTYWRKHGCWNRNHTRAFCITFDLHYISIFQLTTLMFLKITCRYCLHFHTLLPGETVFTCMFV